MEETQLEALKPPEDIFTFPPYRRSHLKSETYRTMVRILSHCYDNTELYDASQVVSQELSEDGRTLRQTTREELCGWANCRDLERMEPEELAIQKGQVNDKSALTNSVQQRALSSVEMVMDDIERMMMIEQNENVIVDDGNVCSGFRDGVFAHEKMLIDELEHIMKGGEEPVLETFTNSLDQKQSVSDKVTPIKVQKENVDCQQIIAEDSGDICQSISRTVFSKNENVKTKILNSREGGEDNTFLVESNCLDNWPEIQPNEIDLETAVYTSVAKGCNVPITKVVESDEEEHCRQNVSEAFVLSVDKDTIVETVGQSNKFKEASPMMTDVSIVQHDMQGKDVVKSVFSNETLVSPNDAAEDGDVEEGEICGDLGLNDRPINTLLENSLILETEVNEVRICEDMMDKNKYPLDRANKKSNESSSFISDSIENGSHGRGVEQRQCGKLILCKNGAGAQGELMKSKERDENDFVPEKERNKQNGSGAKNGLRSATASLNLTLHALVAKEIAIENHETTSGEQQVSGICHKKKHGPPSEERKEKRKQRKRKKRAEKNRQLGVKRLKLHPVTKPKPVVYCRHYLQGRCQEGDKCKFSHDTVPLTKSKPCCHFARHSCMKGDDCPFDHQLSKYPCSNFVSKGSCSRGSSCMFSHEMSLKEESTPTNLKSDLKPLQLSNISNSKRPLNISGPSQPNANAMSNSVEHHSSENTKQNDTKAVIKPSVLAPLGINFLSLGRSSSVHSNNIKPVSSSEKNGGSKAAPVIDQRGFGMVDHSKEIRKITQKEIPKGLSFYSFGKSPVDESISKRLSTLPSSSNTGAKPALADINFHSETSSSVMKNDIVKFNYQKVDETKTVQNANETPKKTQTGEAIKGINFSSSGKVSLDDYSSNRLCSFFSNRKDGTAISPLEGNSAPGKYQNSSAISLMLPPTPLSSGQSSSNSFASPNSAHKALLSTFAFASKFESLMKVNKGSTNYSASGVSRTESTSASKILDFLSGVGGKKND